MKLKSLMMVAAAALVLVSGARAQNQQPDTNQPADPTAPIAPLPPQDASDSNARPAPAARSLLGGVQGQGAGAVQPDSHLLSGGEATGLGFLNAPRNVFDPSLRISEYLDTGLGTAPNSVTSIGGSLNFDQTWSRYRLTTFYSGMQSFYSPSSFFNSAYHYFEISQEIHWSRWILRLRDDLTVSPESSFGGLFTGAAGQAGPTSSLTSLIPTSSSGETALTGRVNRLNDTAMAELDYTLSRRTSLTFTGGYGLLHFFSPGYVDSRDLNARVGYNYALDPKDTLALIYNYDYTSFTGTNGQQRTHAIQAAYGRKVTGRLAFQVAAGPQLLEFGNFGPSNGQHWTWSLFSSANYQISRATGSSLSYSHGATNGSGVFFGAESDTFTGTLTHQFTRYWSASANAGFARNSNLQPNSAITNVYDNWYVGANLFRQIGRQIDLNFSYAFQRQSNGTGCPVASCGLPAGSRHVAAVAMEWHPLAIRPR